MRFFRCLVWLFAFFLHFSPCLGESEEIVVRLSTKHQLLPVYLSPILEEGSELPSSYLSQLFSVLHFDFSRNGTTKVVDRLKELDQVLKGPKPFLGISEWAKKGIFYVVRPEISGRTLMAKVLSVNSETLQESPSFQLTGEIARDRQFVHKLHDAVHASLFGQEGVASTHILYTVRTRPNPDNSETWVSEVFECDYDGANVRQVTREGSYCVTPVYVPPKSGYRVGSFFYVSYRSGQPKIFIASLKDGTGRRFSYLRGNQLMPAITQRRDRVAFISDVAGTTDLFLQPFSPEAGALGKARQIFSTQRATQASPSFSPDGSQVVFVSDKDGGPRIYIMSILSAGKSTKVGKPELITRKCRENTSPCWSPDGTKIAYSAKIDGERQIWIYDVVAKEERQLTTGTGTKENPTWAPDSLHLVFNSASSNSSELYLVNLNQPEAVKISAGKGEKRFPFWEIRN